MYVKIFDFEHELDLEDAINIFLKSCDDEIVDIKYDICHFYDNNNQIFSYSAMIIIKEK